MSSGLHRSHDTVFLGFSNRILYPFFIPFAPNPIHFSESLRLKPIPRPFDFPKFHTAFRFQFLKKYLLEFARAKQINDSPFSSSIFKNLDSLFSSQIRFNSHTMLQTHPSALFVVIQTNFFHQHSYGSSPCSRRSPICLFISRDQFWFSLLSSLKDRPEFGFFAAFFFFRSG